MSVEGCPTDAMPSGLDDVILPRAHDIGGFEVRRALPATQRQMGPGEFLTGKGLDVCPHPHVGLSTVTYLFDGAIQHRDSLGSDQLIVPGDVNWMTAGRGITHSERTAAAARTHSNRLSCPATTRSASPCRSCGFRTCRRRPRGRRPAEARRRDGRPTLPARGWRPGWPLGRAADVLPGRATA